jgi:signal transduction histidine kinase
MVLAVGIGLIFGGLRVADAVGGADQFGRVTQLARLGLQGTILVQDLQNERDETAAVIGGASPATLKSPYAATNTAAAQLRADATALGGGFPANIRSSVAKVLTDAENVGAVRNLARANGNPEAVITDYADPIQDIISLTGLISQGVSDPVLSNDVRTLGSLSQVKEEAAEQRALLVNALTQKFYGTGVEEAVNTAASQQQLDQVAFQTTATSAQQAALASVLSSSQASNAANIEGFLVSDSDPFTDIVNLGIRQTQAPTTWYSLTSYEINQMQGVELGIAQNIVARAQSLQSGAQQSAIITAIVTLALLILVLFATLIVARSLVQPLRRLQAGALHVASVQLPERVRRMSEADNPETTMEVAPINVFSQDEIGQVARAFDQVHSEAVRLAGEQALLRSSFNAMFINLSRRSQSLIERLARTIDRMEQNEDDPDRLGGLFSIDHMVTRMRRNSENLLLLAGHDNPRKWSEAVPLADVARAATSEIEQYNRVTLSIRPGVSVVGPAVSDIVHLIAELVENATNFSPDDTQVNVSAQEPSSGGVLIEIVDKGIGISEARLVEMNSRLDNPPTIDISVSRHMGLFAVARLAERHRVRVRLRPASPEGLSALVWLPDSVIERTSRYGSSGSWSAQRLRSQGAVGGRQPTGKLTTAEGTVALASRGPSGNGNGYDDGTGNGAGNSHGTETSTGRLPSGWFRGHPYISGLGTGSVPGDGHAAAGRVGDRNPADIVAEPAFGDQTATGLPMRVPKATLIPGDVPSGQGITVSGSRSTLPTRGADPGRWPASRPAGNGRQLPQRSPDQVRSRLAGYQRGARRAEEQAGQSQRGDTPYAGEGTIS